MTPLHRKKCRGVFSHDIIDFRFEKRTRKGMKDGIITADGDFVRLYDDWVCSM